MDSRFRGNDGKWPCDVGGVVFGRTDEVVDDLLNELRDGQ
jgi:hypothetical protein